MNNMVPYDAAHIYKACKNLSSRKVINAIESGCYRIGDDKKGVFVDISNMLNKSVEDTFINAVNIPLDKSIKTRTDSEVIFTDIDVMSAVMREMNIFGRSISVLGSGLTTRVCGDWQLNGKGIDESIARCTCAFASCNKYYEEFYKKNAKQDNCGMYNDDILYAKNIPVIMSSPNKYLGRPFVIDYIVASSVNRRKIIGKKPALIKIIPDVLLARAERVLQSVISVNSAISERIVILNPFGCGAFGNSPDQMAHIWKVLLEDKGYKWYFKHVVFICNYQETGISKDVFERKYMEEI